VAELDKNAQDESGAVPDPKSSPVPLSRTMRAILGGLGLMGVFETIYLTWVKLVGTSGAICSTQGCIDVLTGPWSVFLGIPLSAYGMLAYGVFSFLSIWPLLARSETVYTDVDAGTTEEIPSEEVYVRRDNITRGPMLALSSVLIGFSAYLMSLLVWVIKDICPYCIFSAGLTVSIFVFMVSSRAMRSMSIGGTTKVISAGFGISAVASMLSYGLAAPYIPNIPDSPQAPPVVTTYSSRQANKLADKLALKNTKMYGAYWCTHCFDQKQKLGRQAWKKITYIECDKHGVNTQYKLCRQKRIPGYPTWEIDGLLYPGEVQLDTLEAIADEK